jgi:heme-degrading monooxygenase HmoA
MIARLTFFNVKSQHVEDMKRIYNEEITPVIRSQMGNIGTWLLEPTNKIDDFISLTEWASKSDADNYESSGTYKAMLDKVRSMFNGNPLLKTYTISDSKILAHA